MTVRRTVHPAACLPGEGWGAVRTDPRSGPRTAFASLEQPARTTERGLFDFLLLSEQLRLPEHRGRIHDLDAVGRPEARPRRRAPGERPGAGGRPAPGGRTAPGGRPGAGDRPGVRDRPGAGPCARTSGCPTRQGRAEQGSPGPEQGSPGPEQGPPGPEDHPEGRLPDIPGTWVTDGDGVVLTATGTDGPTVDHLAFLRRYPARRRQRTGGRPADRTRRPCPHPGRKGPGAPRRTAGRRPAVGVFADAAGGDDGFCCRLRFPQAPDAESRATTGSDRGLLLPCAVAERVVRPFPSPGNGLVVAIAWGSVF